MRSLSLRSGSITRLVKCCKAASSTASACAVFLEVVLKSARQAKGMPDFSALLSQEAVHMLF